MAEQNSDDQDNLRKRKFGETNPSARDENESKRRRNDRHTNNLEFVDINANNESNDPDLLIFNPDLLAFQTVSGQILR